MNNCLEVYQEPYQESKGTFNYKIKQICLSHETVNLSCFPNLLLNLSLIFP